MLSKQHNAAKTWENDVNLFHLLCTAAGNLNDAIELGEPRAAKLCIEDMRKMLDVIEAEHLPIPFSVPESEAVAILDELRALDVAAAAQEVSP